MHVVFVPVIICGTCGHLYSVSTTERGLIYVWRSYGW